ncbi:MAG: DeoR/GlpR family DNA-binding transcription regulator [Opitutales bacterium]
MHPADRRRHILDRLEQQGAGSYDEFARALRVSTMTVRRDLADLIRQGAVIQTVGGVQRAPAPSYLYETAVHSRLAVQRGEKRAIARAALGLVAEGQTLFLDGSTTCLELARLLARERKHLTIVTNSVLTCLELGRNPDHTLTGLGGHYDANSLCFVGPEAEDAAGRLFVDLAFVGTKAFLPAKGTFESSAPNFRLKQIIARQAAQVVLLADHTKFGQRALSPVLDIAQIHTVVTDDRAPRADLAALARKQKRVILAPAGRAAPKGTAHAA